MNPRPSPLPEVRGWDRMFQPSDHGVGSLAASLIPGAFQHHLVMVQQTRGGPPTKPTCASCDRQRGGGTSPGLPRFWGSTTRPGSWPGREAGSQRLRDHGPGRKDLRRALCGPGADGPRRYEQEDAEPSTARGRLCGRGRGAPCPCGAGWSRPGSPGSSPALCSPLSGNLLVPLPLSLLVCSRALTQSNK